MMLSRKDFKERFTELWDDDEVFNDFVEGWIEEHPDSVFDMIASSLAEDLEDTG